jgi:heme A synthase
MSPQSFQVGHALLGAAISGTAVAIMTLAQSVDGTGTTTTWISGGSAAIAVAALAYIARQFASGNLVAKDTAATERRLTELTEQNKIIADASMRREEILMTMLMSRVGSPHPSPENTSGYGK